MNRRTLQMHTDLLMIRVYGVVEGMAIRMMYGIAWAMGVMLGLTLFLQVWKLTKGLRQ